MKCIPWETWEDDFLADVAATMTVEQISEKLERTVAAVYYRAYAKKIKLSAKPKGRTGRKWTRAEVSLFKQFSNEEIAIATCRTIYAVRAMRNKLSRILL